MHSSYANRVSSRHMLRQHNLSSHCIDKRGLCMLFYAVGQSKKKKSQWQSVAIYATVCYWHILEANIGEYSQRIPAMCLGKKSVNRAQLSKCAGNFPRIIAL